MNKWVNRNRWVVVDVALEQAFLAIKVFTSYAPTFVY